MIEIEYKGGNAVVISTKKSTLMADPKVSGMGLKDVVVKDAVEVATEPRFSLASLSARLVIDGPGEYEVGDFAITGVTAQRHIDTKEQEPIGSLYRIEVEDVRIALLGNVAPRLSEEQLEAIGLVDILIIPVGGGGLTLDAVDAAKLARQIEPKVVIPVHYADNNIKYEMPQDGLEHMIKELGAPIDTTDKYKIKSPNDLPETMSLVQVNRT